MVPSRFNIVAERARLKALERNGWVKISTDLQCEFELRGEVLGLASALGQPNRGRGRELVETIVPRDISSAYVGSLSARYGLTVMPLHVDTSHWTVPARYLVFGCVHPGDIATPTILCDRYSVELTKEQELLTKSALFHVQNGRHSFYASIRGNDPNFIRYDPGCMVPASPNALDALDVFSLHAVRSRLIEVKWCAGDILAIDNWRMLHGRGPSENSIGRTLLRCTVT